MPPPQKIRLGDLLIQQGLLTNEQLKLSLDEQKRTGRKLGRVFVESGYVTEEGISQALARQLKIPFVDLKNFSPKPDLIKLLPEAPARRFRAMVLEQMPDGRLLIGMSDPTDFQAYDEITRLVKREIEQAVVTESQLLAMIERVYQRQSTSRNGLPGVSGVSGLGLLFGQKESSNVKRELVILMRSTIISGENSWRENLSESQQRMLDLDPRQRIKP